MNYDKEIKPMTGHISIQEKGDPYCEIITQSAHTPTPWMVAADGYISQKVKPDAEGNPEGQTIALMHNFSAKYANAAYIVKAVNCHDELVEAVDNLLDLLDETIGPFKEEDILPNGTIDHARKIAEKAGA